MRLSRDERRALAFVGLLIALSAVARVVDRRAGPVPADAESADVSELAAASDSVAADEERRSRPLAPGERINPNTAPAAELDRLPGVGPALAGRIIASRERDGAFRSVSDLRRVAGIGERTAERLAGLLDVSRADGARVAPADRPLHPNSVLLRSRPDADDDGPLDPNLAAPEELERLTGIGPVLARRIAAHRDSVGRFEAVDDLERVPGIGPRTLARIRDDVRINP